MTTPGYHSDPHVSFLTQILDEIRSGLIQIPRFQRPLVWTWEQRLELLRSIRDGIPMGAIMVWRSQVASFDCYKYLGPHRLERADGANQYLLDGVQRLSTLVGALNPSTPNTTWENDDEFDDDPPTEDFEVFFDLTNNDFVRSVDITSKSEVMPLNLVFDSVGMLRFQRSLDEKNFEHKIRATEDIAKAFREYKVPVIPIVTDDIEMATRTFQRINSQGKAMSEAHMIHALSWGSKFDLNREIRRAKQKYLYAINWSDIDDDVILKACKAALQFGIYTKNADDIGAAFRNDPEVVTRVVKATAETADFLENFCGIPTPELVPYSLQLVILIDTFRRCEISFEPQKIGLRDWFWTTTYGEYFAGMSGDRFDRALDDVHDGVINGAFELTVFKPFEIRAQPDKFDFRSARAKAYAFLLAQRMNRLCGDLAGTKLLAKFGRECIQQVLPRLDKNASIYSQYANRFLLDPQSLILFKDKLLNGDLTAEEMELHIIDEDMLNDLLVGNHNVFLTKRKIRIAQKESNFILKNSRSILSPKISDASLRQPWETWI